MEQIEKVYHTIRGVHHWVKVLALMVSNYRSYIHRMAQLAKEAHAAGEEIEWPEGEETSATVQAHMISLSLTHIDNRLELLQEWDVLHERTIEAVSDFRGLYSREELKDLRDALEHSDEYAAGLGKYPDRIVKDLNQNQTPGTVSDRNTVTRIGLFGRFYYVGEVIAAAYEVDTIFRSGVVTK